MMNDITKLEKATEEIIEEPKKKTKDDFKLKKHLVDSSNIEWVAYDDKKKELYVHFHSHSTYKYDKVPKNVFERLLKAGSKGRFFAMAIKWEYKYERIE